MVKNAEVLSQGTTNYYFQAMKRPLYEYYTKRARRRGFFTSLATAASAGRFAQYDIATHFVPCPISVLTGQRLPECPSNKIDNIADAFKRPLLHLINYGTIVAVYRCERSSYLLLIGIFFVGVIFREAKTTHVIVVVIGNRVANIVVLVLFIQ